VDASIFLRFDDADDIVRPRDAAGNLGDLIPTNVPPVVDGVIGFARSFGGAAAMQGYETNDLVPGTTLHTRDLSIQAILTWDAALATLGNAGTIIARGRGNSAAEYHPYALEIRLIDLASLVGEIRWVWMDTAGVEHVQPGAQFQAPSGFTMFTATRRWVSTTEVWLRYYLGDVLLLEVPSTNGDIGGGTTGHTSVGQRYVSGAPSRWYGGKIDELRVVPRELTTEEIEATWKRITVNQPAGYALLRELHDPGFPISNDPDSRVQRETRMWGHALGFASAQADNMGNLLPDRAYGSVLESWERITAQAPKPGDSTDFRRGRVVAKLSAHAGVSIPGAKASLERVVDTLIDNLQFIAFPQDTVDDYLAAGSALNLLRHEYNPSGQWTNSSNALRVQASTNVQLTGDLRDWYTTRMSIGGNGRGTHLLAKIIPTTLGATSEVGLWWGDLVHGNLVLMGYRSTFDIVTEVFTSWASGGATVRGNLGSLVTAWLHLFSQDLGALVPIDNNEVQKFTAAWSTTAEAGPYTSVANIAAGFADKQWAGMYARTIGAGTPTIDVKFDDFKTRAPYGDRSFFWYVFRDPALTGTPDLIGGQKIISELGQAHTRGALITVKASLCDDPSSLCDLTPLGAI
jgi:hypothetical protein